MIFQNDVITKEKLHSITMEIPPMIVKNLWDTIVATSSASNIARLTAAVEKIILDGYPLSILLSLVTSYVVNNTGWNQCRMMILDLEDKKKAEICLELARADKAVCDGCDEELLLLSTCCTLVKLVSSVCCPGHSKSVIYLLLGFQFMSQATSYH